jgi:hypothetical protein
MNKILISIIIIAGLLLPFAFAEAARTQTYSGSGYFVSVGDALNTIYYNSGPVNVGSSASGLATLFVQGFSGSATSTFAVASSTGVQTFAISSNGTTTLKQYQGFGIPNISTSTGIGTSPNSATLSAGSSDLAGRITILTGGTPAVTATVFTLNFASSTGMFCTVSPFSTTTAQLYGGTSTVFTLGTTSISMSSNTTALPAATTFVWNYMCN